MSVSDHDSSEGREDAVLDNNIRRLGIKVNQITGQLREIQEVLTQQIENAQQQNNDIEKELGLLVERVNAGTEMPEGFAQDFTGLKSLYNKLQLIQADVENVSNTTARLVEERDTRQNELKDITRQIEALTKMKADREEVDELLNDKADRTQINEKVSQQQLTSSIEELHVGLQEAKIRLHQQELLWHEALEVIQNDIVNKLDKKEIAPFKELINKKLRALHEKLHLLKKERGKGGAAATKLFKDVNCLSCNTDAAMQYNILCSIPKSQPLIPQPNLRPYLTYQLNELRKENRRRPAGKKVNWLQDALAPNWKDRSDIPEKPVLPTSKGVHFCNRYCGGSHTSTLPQQRVTRVGKFYTSLDGLEAMKLKSEGEKKCGSKSECTEGPQMGGHRNYKASKLKQDSLKKHTGDQ